MVILDTNVVSELMRPSPSTQVLAWMDAQSGGLHTTAITVAEIRHGIARLVDGKRKELLATTADDVLGAFDDQVLAFDKRAALGYAAILSDCERRGRPIDGFDAQIASICREHDAPLATRNRTHFEHAGITVVDPWQASPDPPGARSSVTR